MLCRDQLGQCLLRGTTIVLVVALPIQLAAQSPVSSTERSVSLENPALDERAQQPSPALPAPMELRLDHLPRSRWETSPVHFLLDCTTCGGADEPIGPDRPTNPNAPWIVQAAARYTNRMGTFSAGVIGVRNYAPPLYVGMSPGQAFQVSGAASTSQTNFFVPETQWHLTVAFVRTLWTHSRGASVGLTADFLLPVNTDLQTNDLSRIDPLPSRAIRFGVIVRW
jgi:hypothetical protein